jgi:hypothetical protein
VVRRCVPRPDLDALRLKLGFLISPSVDGDLAALCGAATLPSARGQGAQGALMGRRLADAWAAGAQHIGSDTGSESPDHPNPSLHNMRRVGLTEAYTRTNYIWRAASS